MKNREICRAAILRGLFAATALMAAVPLLAQNPLFSKLESLAEREPLHSSVWGVMAVNMKGDTVAAFNSSQRMVPASNTKLLSTGVALKTLGADYRFETRIGYVGIIENGCLNGDLYIMGGADPTIGVQAKVEDVFHNWKAILDKAGILEIEGRVIADSRYLRNRGIEKSWQYEDLECGDALVPRGLNFQKNVRDYKNLFSKGFIAESAPEDTCAAAFCQYLVQEGFSVAGGSVSVDPDGMAVRDSIILLGSSRSIPLSAIVKETNYQSDNFYAETLYRLMSDRYIPVLDALGRMGLPTCGNIQLYDGCGLSRKDYVSPAYFVSFLKAMHSTDVFDCFLKSMPQPGSGTLAIRLRKAPESTKKRIYMKSGSMNGVCCYSGYILPSGGDEAETIAFSLMTNNVVDPQGRLGGIIDEIIMAIAGMN